MEIKADKKPKHPEKTGDKTSRDIKRDIEFFKLCFRQYNEWGKLD